MKKYILLSLVFIAQPLFSMEDILSEGSEAYSSDHEEDVAEFFGLRAPIGGAPADSPVFERPLAQRRNPAAQGPFASPGLETPSEGEEAFRENLLQFRNPDQDLETPLPLLQLRAQSMRVPTNSPIQRHRASPLRRTRTMSPLHQGPARRTTRSQTLEQRIVRLVERLERTAQEQWPRDLTRRMDALAQEARRYPDPTVRDAILSLINPYRQ